MTDMISKITQILVNNLDPQKVWLFGSRAGNKARRNSDYDVAFEGSSADFRTLRKTKDEISEVLGIYSCDIVDLSKTGSEFRELIHDKGKIIYERD